MIKYKYTVSIDRHGNTIVHTADFGEWRMTSQLGQARTTLSRGKAMRVFYRQIKRLTKEFRVDVSKPL